MTSTITISAEQRDALYEQLIDRLSGIGDIEVAVGAGEFDKAARLGREYADELRFLTGDLGFGEGDGERVPLRTPREVLSRLLPRMQERAEGFESSLTDELADAQVQLTRCRHVRVACASILNELGVEAVDEEPEAPERRE